MAGNVKQYGAGPRPRKPHPAKGNQYGLRSADWQISLDKKAFDQLVKSYGVRMTHYRALPNPVGMSSRGDNHAVLATARSDDQFIYKEAGVCTVFFANNSSSSSQGAMGVIDHATAYMTLPDVYDDTKTPVLVSTWDRFFLKDVEVRVVKKQFVESNSTGIDRLQFPATAVELLIDARGIEYEVDRDFIITEEGFIKWTGQNRPGWNPQIGKGTVYAVRYRYTPFFIVNKILHEIRVTQITNPANFKRSLERMPYQVEVMREHIFQDVNRDPNNPNDDPRFDQAPPSGGALGPQ